MKTAVSLFAGIGGFDLALERQGVKVVASVEIDKKAQDVLRKHFPNSTLYPYGGLPRGVVCAIRCLFVNCVNGKAPAGLLSPTAGGGHPPGG